MQLKKTEGILAPQITRIIFSILADRIFSWEIETPKGIEIIFT